MTIRPSISAKPGPRPSLRGMSAAVTALAITFGFCALGSAQDTGIVTSLVPDYGQGDTESVVINVFECRDAIDDTLTFTATFDETRFNDGTNNSEFSFKLETAANACTEDLTTSGDGCELLQEPEVIAADFVETYDLSFAAATGIDDVDKCRTDDQTVNFIVNSVYGVGDGTDTGEVSDDFSLILKLTAPEAPSNLSAVAGEKSIQLSFDAPATTDEETTYNAYISTTPDFVAGQYTDDFSVRGIRRIVGGSSTSVTINDGISVGQDYYLVVVAEDSDGNESAVSEVVTVTTVPTNDFYELYRQSGGEDTGGFLCSTTAVEAPASPLSSLVWLVLGGLALLALRRVGRTRLAGPLAALAVAGASLLTPASASADEPIPTGHFEIRLGSYLPSVDDGLADPGPYKLIFDNESMLLAEVEIDRVLYNGIGTAGFGGSFGFMQAVGKAVDGEGNASVDTTVFNIIPLRLLAFYQADFLVQELYIPLVPILKVGINYFLWWVTESSGSVANSDGDSGSGGTFGWQVAVGLHLLLDWFDETAANNLRYEFGIDNSYFFTEYMMAEVDDFGSSSSIDLSDETLMFGLAFDY